MSYLCALGLFGGLTNEVDNASFARHTDDMKSAAFNTMLSKALTTPEATVITFARRLKEAGMLTTGARGRHAPEMTGAWIEAHGGRLKAFARREAMRHINDNRPAR